MIPLEDTILQMTWAYEDVLSYMMGYYSGIARDYQNKYALERQWSRWQNAIFFPGNPELCLCA